MYNIIITLFQNFKSNDTFSLKAGVYRKISENFTADD